MTGKRARNESETNLLDLPPDVLLLILSKFCINKCLSTLSLVSKLFRSLTCNSVNTLAFSRLPSDHAFRKLFARFPSVTRIVISSNRIARALTAIANSGLKIESLEIQRRPTFPKMEQIVSLSGKFKSVKSLKFQWFGGATESQVVEFVHLFPSLEDLDLGFCINWSDVGIKKLVAKALNLRKLNLNCNQNVGDPSLDALSSCVNLEQVSLMYCGHITVQGLCTFIQKKKNLKWLEVPNRLYTDTQDNFLSLANTISFCENLTHLSIKGPLVQDDFLSIIGCLRAPLTSIELNNAYYLYTLVGLSALLRAFQGLTKLHIYTAWKKPDDAHLDTEMSRIVKSLPCLRDVILFPPCNAFDTLCTLIQYCPLLESITIKVLYDEDQHDLPRQLKKNYSVQRIILYPEPLQAVKKALRIACPSLKILKYSFWSNY